MTKRWLVVAALVLALNFAWEMAQGGLFADMAAMPFWAATVRCLKASLGDVVITAAAFGIASLVARDVRWPVGPRPLVPFLVFLAVGLSITVALERYAIATGRWQYGARMPLILGVGLLPIAQWIAVPAAGVAIIRASSARWARSPSERTARTLGSNR